MKNITDPRIMSLIPNFRTQKPNVRRSTPMFPPIRTGGFELKHEGFFDDNEALERNAKKGPAPCTPSTPNEKHTAIASSSKKQDSKLIGSSGTSALSGVMTGALDSSKESHDSKTSHSSPLESSPESRGWVKSDANGDWYKNGAQMGIKKWGADAGKWIATVQKEDGTREWAGGNDASFADWRLIDELLFESEPQEYDGFVPALKKFEWKARWKCGKVRVSTDGYGWYAHKGKFGLLDCARMGDTGCAEMFKSYPLLKIAMRKAGII